MLTSGDDMASMNAFVPDCAIVPRFAIISAFVMPIPESVIVKELFDLSGVSWMLSSGLLSSVVLSVSDWWRILSSASEELEISSRRKISLLE